MAKVKLNTLSLLNDSKYFDETGSKFGEMRKMLDSRDGIESSVAFVYFFQIFS